MGEYYPNYKIYVSKISNKLKLLFSYEEVDLFKYSLPAVFLILFSCWICYKKLIQICTKCWNSNLSIINFSY